MNKLHEQIDFTELGGDVPGERLEELTFALTERMGLNPEWSGRGADGGRDIILQQEHRLPLKATVRWIVSCKDYAASKHSVSESDIPSVRDKLDQFTAQGYLLVTTTTASTGAKNLLDGIADRRTGFTDVWNGARLRELLLRPDNDHLLLQFLPASHARIRATEGTPSDGIVYVAERFSRTTETSVRPLLIPGIREPLVRTETGDVEELLGTGRNVVLAGEPGTGKSGIAYALCGRRSDQTSPVLLLDAQKLSTIRSVVDIALHLELRDGFGTSVQRLAERTGCRIVIDQLDSVSAATAGNVLVDAALECAGIEGVRVIVVSRRREGYEQMLLNRLTERGFTLLECEELDAGTTRDVLGRIDIADPPDDLIALSKNLLNLSIIARIKERRPDHDFSAVLDQIDLWEGFVGMLHSGELRSHEGPTFGQEVVDEASRLARQGLTAEDRTFELLPMRTPAQRRLDSWRVIVQVDGNKYGFFHENFQDYLYARSAAERGLMPDAVLGEISKHRTRTVFPWMEQIYKHRNSPSTAEFLRRTFNVNG